jgi:hypothetical protein
MSSRVAKLIFPDPPEPPKQRSHERRVRDLEEEAKPARGPSAPSCAWLQRPELPLSDKEREIAAKNRGRR